jgi:hypothetical protein
MLSGSCKHTPVNALWEVGGQRVKVNLEESAVAEKDAISLRKLAVEVKSRVPDTFQLGAI